MFGNLFKVLAGTGLRLSEALGLTWDRVYENHLLIDRTVAREIDGGFQPTKSGKERLVPLPSTIKKILKEIPHNGDFVFCNVDGTRLTINTVERRFKKYALEGLRIHDLRHTYAYISLRAGVDYKSLSDALGHYSTAFTMDVYAYSTDQSRVEQASKVDSVFRHFSVRNDSKK